MKDQKRLISFKPESFDLMWAPCLWDEWSDRTGKIYFKSFAIITDEPPVEIERMGHDRCPIFIKKSNIDTWLNPQKFTEGQILKTLRHKTNAHYVFRWED